MRARFGFNPRARGGRDQRQAYSIAKQKEVSIHAPAGGATQWFVNSSSAKKVSIHAPAGGATKIEKKRLTFIAFQSTRPRGARRTK